MKRFLIATLSLFAFLAIASAQTVPSIPTVTKAIGQTATVSWTAPTTFTDGSTIPSTDTISYSVYEATQAIGSTCTSPTFSTPVVTGVTTLNWVTPAYTGPGTYCYAVTDTINGVESGFSNTVQTTVPVPKGNPPQATIS